MFCSGRGRPVIPAEFAGVPSTTLQAWLVEAQTVLQALEMGQNPNTVSYTQGAGGKSVGMTAATPDGLRQRIRTLSAALGFTPRRRPISPGF